MGNYENRKLKRGDIYYFYLPQLYNKNGEPIEHMQQGIRPCIIVDNDMALKASPNVKVIPLTTQIKKENYPYHVLIDDVCLKRKSMALIECETLVSKSMKLDFLGTLTSESIYEIDIARLKIMGFPQEVILQAVNEIKKVAMC